MQFIKKAAIDVKNIFAHPKLTTLLLSVLLFSVIYTFLDDKNFSGVNEVKETIKDELIKKRIKTNVGNEPFVGYFRDTEDYYNKNIPQNLERSIGEAKREVAKDVAEEELVPDKIDQPFSQRLFDRTYFSFTTATLLGFGDIYPVTNISKFVVMIQAFITVGLIVF